MGEARKESGEDLSAVSGSNSSSTRKFTATTRGTGKYNGWNQQGLDMYTILDEKLEEQREDITLQHFETNLREMFITNGIGRITSKYDGDRKRKIPNGFARLKMARARMGLSEEDTSYYETNIEQV